MGETVVQVNRLTGGALALTHARELTGRPYVWGGTWPKSGGTDCSGLWQYAYGKVGVLLARTTYEQYLEFPIPNSWPSEPGDLLFISGSDAIGAKPGHVMAYVSPGQVFQAEYTGGPPIGQFPANTNVFEYRTRPALALPMPKAPATKNPSALQLSSSGLILLTSPAKARLALANGWSLYMWEGWEFVVETNPNVKGRPLYANFDYVQKRH